MPWASIATTDAETERSAIGTFLTLPDSAGTLTPEAGGREMASMRADYPPLLQYRAVGEAGREERV